MDNNELLAEIKKFNRNVEWLKKRELKEKFTASASEIMSLTGWTRERLRGERKRGGVKYDKATERYSIDSLPDIYKQKFISTGRQQSSPPAA